MNQIVMLTKVKELKAELFNNIQIYYISVYITYLCCTDIKHQLLQVIALREMWYCIVDVFVALV